MNLEKSNYTLLYIEDEAPTRMVTAMYLQNYFKEIYEASNGEEGLRLYQEKSPDIIITDIEMPKMNGLAFCQTLRNKDKHTPIIITTAYTSVEYLLQAVSLNLIKYLGKPLKEEEIKEALDLCFEHLESQNPSIIQLTDTLYYDMLNQSLSSQEKLIPLSSSLSMLLNILLKNRTRIVSYQEIENEIWYDKVMTPDSLRTLVRKLRKIVGKEVIENISKTGYKINIHG